MKKLVLLSLLGLAAASQVECSVGSNAKLFAKNMAKTAVYTVGTAATGAISVASYVGAEQIAAETSTVQLARISSLLSGDLQAFLDLGSYLQFITSCKPVLYGISAVFGLAAVYSGFKTLQSTYKTLTFEE